ncbi:uncharacterized protein TDEL_0D03430 [Torulaspora delbrueckii]|uniref:C2H2-type domain-containing protein n=1 Tax=Torulaspora delbrueckii TaxID=4950 RepID=G8ZTI3_TORDE|nr:hypothetical protein TDEL_0D03430 [Torulaspora delbrueckii]CCE91927.1 hypothetical protein TDEL_0D03430 [Torulaspora delbrueckii]
MISQPVSVLPLPLASDAGIERKYFTLLPSIADTHVIEDDLKYRLNKCAFDSPRRVSVNLPTPSTSPISSLSDFRTLPISPASSVYNSGSESSTSTDSSRRNRVSKQEAGVSKVEQRRRHVCKVCSKGFTTSGHLARHNRIHTGEKNHFCPLEGCNQRFSRHDNCIQHYRTHLRKK